jgi:hypothetical protein
LGYCRGWVPQAENIGLIGLVAVAGYIGYCQGLVAVAGSLLVLLLLLPLQLLLLPLVVVVPLLPLPLPLLVLHLWPYEPVGEYCQKITISSKNTE